MATFYQRLAQRIIAPQFLRPMPLLTGPEEAKSFRIGEEWAFFHFTITPTGHIGNVLYQTVITGRVLGILDVIVEFCQGKDRRQLLALNVREIENYLRDENHLPAQGVDLALAQSILQSVTDSLVQAIASRISQKCEAVPPIAFEHFSQQRLSKQIQDLQGIFGQQIRPVLELDGGSVELLNVIDQKIVIEFGGNCTSCPGARGPTLAFIQDIIKVQLPGFHWEISIIE